MKIPTLVHHKNTEVLMRTIRCGGVTLWQLHLYMSVYCQSRTEFMIFPSFISESDEAFDAFVSYQRADNDTTL